MNNYNRSEWVVEHDLQWVGVSLLQNIRVFTSWTNCWYHIYDKINIKGTVDIISSENWFVKCHVGFRQYSLNLYRYKNSFIYNKVFFSYIYGGNPQVADNSIIFYQKKSFKGYHCKWGVQFESLQMEIHLKLCRQTNPEKLYLDFENINQSNLIKWKFKSILSNQLKSDSQGVHLPHPNLNLNYIKKIESKSRKLYIFRKNLFFIIDPMIYTDPGCLNKHGNQVKTSEHRLWSARHFTWT